MIPPGFFIAIIYGCAAVFLVAVLWLAHKSSRVSRDMSEAWRESERKKAEQECREKGVRFYTLFECANDAILLMDQDKFLECNALAAATFGCADKRQIENHSPVEFSPARQPDGRGSAQAARGYIQAALGGQPQRFYWQHQRRDGTLFDAEVSLNALTLGGGTYLQSIVRDITERKRTEEALRKAHESLEQRVRERTQELLNANQTLQRILFELKRSEERFQAIAATTEEVIWEVDGNGRYTYCNPMFENILGYKPEELIGRDFRELLDPADRAALERPLPARGMRRKSFQNVINRYLHKDGQLVILDTAGTPMQDETGAFAGYRGAGRDITARKKAEQELRSAYEQLKNTQTQLLQSAKMASVGQLAGGVAHEINNPLAVVLGNAQLLRMMAQERPSLASEAFQDVFSAIEESAMRCKRITDALLSFSHAASRVMRPLCINSVVENVVHIIAHELNLQDVSLETRLQPGLPRVQGESQLLQQVVVDLVVNAKWAVQKRDARAAPGVIRIRTAAGDSGRRVELAVWDNGVGIDPEHLGHIFDPFFTTKPVGEGAGLGLSIVYNIVKEHGGTIRAESRPGQGTEFRISLPAAAMDAPEAAG